MNVLIKTYQVLNLITMSFILNVLINIYVIFAIANHEWIIISLDNWHLGFGNEFNFSRYSISCESTRTFTKQCKIKDGNSFLNAFTDWRWSLIQICTAFDSNLLDIYCWIPVKIFLFLPYIIIIFLIFTFFSFVF